MTLEIPFNAGDIIRQPVVLVCGTLIPNIAGWTVTATAYWNSLPQFVLDTESGIAVDNTAPPASAEEDTQRPHLTLTIDTGADGVGKDIPLGRVGFLELRAGKDGVSVSFEKVWLWRLR